MKVTEPIGILRISHSTCCSLLRSITEVALEHLVGLPSASSLQGWQAFATSSIQLPKESLCGLWCCCSSCNVVYKWDPLLTLGSKFILMQVVAMPSPECSELDRLLHLITRILSWVSSAMLLMYLCFIIYICLHLKILSQIWLWKPVFSIQKMNLCPLSSTTQTLYQMGHGCQNETWYPECQRAW